MVVNLSYAIFYLRPKNITFSFPRRKQISLKPKFDYGYL